MAKIKRKVARKAVKSTAKHTAHGTASKLKRDPMRTATLLGIGAAAGALATWFFGRDGEHGGNSPHPQSA
ncbi:MAG TPA: hypothetical protein VMS60_05600 [Solirubrobacterales bacterium]|nr:hypothetical protein [Solirubrobacterales bacterium]